MKAAIALAALALLVALLGSAWARRDDWDFTGESRSMLLSVVLCFIAVVIILGALGGTFW